MPRVVAHRVEVRILQHTAASVRHLSQLIGAVVESINSS
jgi:hypothetical protein